MREYYTEAVVLGARSVGEGDKLVDLYTKDLGRVKAKVVGGSKIVSKLSPHLVVGAFTEVRLIEKNQFTVADAMTKGNSAISHKELAVRSNIISLLFMLKSLLPELEADLRFWHALAASLKDGKTNKKVFLKLLGYNSLLAHCENCYAKKVSHFSVLDYSFICYSCFKKIGRPPDQFVYLD